MGKIVLINKMWPDRSLLEIASHKNRIFEKRVGDIYLLLSHKCLRFGIVLD